jgi:glycosyltransferase involved in cell wall biosynthesis
MKILPSRGGTRPKLPEHAAGTASTGARWPRISLVTAVRNGARYLEDTIRSVISQGYPNLEYIVVDGVSTDGTLEIIRKYENDISWWVSQPDKGLYDALNTGFARSTGEVMGWLNASDMLHTGGLLVVGSVFRDLPQVEWITGRPTRFNEEGMTIGTHDVPHWSRYRFLAGANCYIQQESTYWRRSLWERAGSHLDSSQRVVGDFGLWVRFFRYAKLYTVDALIGGFRVHSGQLALQDMDANQRVQDAYIESELHDIPWGKSLKLFRQWSNAVKSVPKVRGLWQRFLIDGLYRIPGPDWPPLIRYENDQWVYR